MACQERKDKNYCIKCNKRYTIVDNKWCKECSRNYLRKNFTDWTSGNEKIDNFIQNMQLGINYSWNIIFEWIPYNQFNNIKKVYKDNLYSVYSAKWINGPLCWETWDKKYMRRPDKEVVLNYLNNLQNIEEFLNEV
jgi:hypothetical protein